MTAHPHPTQSKLSQLWPYGATNCDNFGGGRGGSGGLIECDRGGPT